MVSERPPVIMLGLGLMSNHLCLASGQHISSRLNAFLSGSCVSSLAQGARGGAEWEMCGF